MKVVALDYGRARTGVAVSDPTGELARPLGVVERASSDVGLERLAAIVAEEEAEKVVVGLPLTLERGRGEQARETERFVAALARGLPCRSSSTTSVYLRPRGWRRRARRCSSALRLPPPEPGTVSARAGAAALAVVSLVACGSESAPPAATVPLPKVLRIVFPEGFTRAQMVERVDAVRKIARVKRKVTMRMTSSDYAAATAAAPIPAPFRRDANEQIEGFLFPATYAFFANERARRFVGRQLEAFRKAWRRVDMRYARSKNLTPYDVLIIASMIEREVVVPRERRLVAAVVYNRLRAGMPLGIDATLRYGLGIPPTEPITRDDLASPSPYNTRIRTGLPPTPIANPGLASIQGRRIRRRSTTSTSCASRIAAATSSRPALPSSRPTLAKGSSASGPARLPAHGVSLAADAECCLRRVRARLVVRARADSRGSSWSRRSRAYRSSALPARTSRHRTSSRFARSARQICRRSIRVIFGRGASRVIRQTPRSSKSFLPSGR